MLAFRAIELEDMRGLFQTIAKTNQENWRVESIVDSNGSISAAVSWILSIV